MNFLIKLFDTTGFPARWKCGSGWADNPWLGWEHILSDIAIWSAYFAIPGILLFFIYRRKDFPFSKIFLLFGAFILSCGMTHLMEAIIFWWPAYGLAGLIKLITAMASWMTVFALFQVVPQALAMRSPDELEREILARKKIEEELRDAKLKLERQLEALHASEERFRLLVDGTKEYGLFMLSPVGEIVSWNPGAERILGYRTEEIVGRHFSLLHPPSERERRRPERGLQAAIAESRYEEEGARVRKDGTEFIAAVITTCLYDPQGNLRGFSKLIQDVTEKKKSEELAHKLSLEETARKVAEEHAQMNWEQREQLRVTLQSIGDGVIATDAQANVQFLNAVAETLTGWASQEASGHPLEQVFQIINESSRQTVQNPARRAIQEGRIVGLANHTLLISKDGTERPIADSAAPIEDEQGKLMGVVLVFRDVTEAKRLEEQFRQAQKMEAVGRLAGGVAHDFNNLLTVINGYGKYLEDDPTLSQDNRLYVTQIQKAGEQAAVLTRQLLAFSRQQLLQPSILSLNDVIKATGTMLERLIGEDIKLATLLGPSLRPVKVERGQIEQVLMNLALNARDAMPQGGNLSIETANINLDESYTRTHADVIPGPHVVLSVSDNGCGMDQKTLGRIFEPFFTTKEPGKGTGLGLATVYGVIKQSGGHVTVYSEPGKGTTFKIYLPQVDPPLESRLDIVPDTAPKGGSETILVVEDAELIRNLACHILRSQGYTVLEASNGKEALKAVEQHPGVIHMVLTDVVMPEMSGRQLSERLRVVKPGLKVLFMSGYTDDAVVRHGVLEAETNFIQKPFSPSSLAGKVRDLLERG
ncbi:MAG: PAS domain S-box protein [Planctomycetales bacterium]